MNFRCGGAPVAQSAPESWWLHHAWPLTWSNRITGTLCGGATNFINHSNFSALAAINGYYDRQADASLVDIRFNDDMGTFNRFVNETPVEYPNDSAFIYANERWMGGERHPDGRPIDVIFNGCDANSYQDSGTEMIKSYPNIIGCATEGGIWSAANGGVGWAAGSQGGRIPYMLDLMARVAMSSNGGIFVVGPETDTVDPPGSAGQLRARRVVTGFVWLGYMSGRVVEWEELQYGSPYVNVFPEEGIYPTRPLQTMSSPSGCPNLSRGSCAAGGHHNIQVALGVFRREFANCYNQRVSIGRCAVIFNATNAPVRIQPGWLVYSYAHQVVMRGGVVDTGGTVYVSGAIFRGAGTVIPAADDILLTR